MEVSRSAFYAWLRPTTSNRHKQNLELKKKVAESHELAKGSYGRRRIAADINKERAEGSKVSTNRIERRMKDLGLKGYTPPSFKRATIGDPLLLDSPNLLLAAKAENIDEILISDITYIATREGWLYLCSVIDLCSRKVVGWSMRSDMTASIVLEAFNSAIKSRQPTGKVIFHSDKGGQYKAKKFRRKLKREGFEQSMTGVNHCFDNATAESFFGRLKNELIRGKKFETREEAKIAIFEYIEVFYNRVRLHSSLGHQSPAEFEGKITKRVS